METIRVVLETDLLRAVDKAARRARVSRSALVRRALREHLKRLEMQELEIRDRRGYYQRPDDSAEVTAWEQVAEWPER